MAMLASHARRRQRLKAKERSKAKKSKVKVPMPGPGQAQPNSPSIQSRGGSGGSKVERHLEPYLRVKNGFKR